MPTKTATAYYAAGAGLGHLQRLLKVSSALNLSAPLSIFSNSRFIKQQSANPQYPVINQHFLEHRFISLPENTQPGFLARFADILAENNIKTLVIDTFPVGIKGELNGLSQRAPKLNIIFIARLLKWQNYKALVKASNTFCQCFYIEELKGTYQQYLQSCSNNIEALSLPTLSKAQQTTTTIAALPQHYCAISHTGNTEELETLIRYAQTRLKMQQVMLPIVLICPDKPACLTNYPEIIQISIYPALPILLNADIIVSAAGFKTLHELREFNKPHWVLPFERRYDDQFLRAERLKG